jgi:hypothetical protein
MSEITESSTNMPEPNIAAETPPVESKDKLTAQLLAYKRCFSELQAELAEIEAQFGADPETEKEDPLKVLAGEVGAFKSEMAELRKMLEELRNVPQNNYPAQQPPQQYPQQQYYMPPQPIVTPTPLPYLQTPTFAPLMPTLPNFNR